MNHLIQEVKDELTKLETMFRASRFEALRHKLGAIFSHPAVVAAGQSTETNRVEHTPPSVAQVVTGGPIDSTSSADSLPAPAPITTAG